MSVRQIDITFGDVVYWPARRALEHGLNPDVEEVIENNKTGKIRECADNGHPQRSMRNRAENGYVERWMRLRRFERLRRFDTEGVWWCRGHSGETVQALEVAAALR